MTKFNIKAMRDGSGKPENQEAEKPKGEQAKKQENQPIEKSEGKMVNLCAKVPESHRRWWAGQAKMRGLTMTEVIVQALAAEFGLPESQKTK